MPQEQKLDILLVDDDEGHAELVRRNFQRIGLTNNVTTLTGGEAALDYMFQRGAFANRRSGIPILILLDVKMPGRVDGIEVLRQIKADPRTHKTPVVMLTTTDDPREVSRCYELGCSVYLTKPVEPARFIEAIRRLGLFISVISVPEEGSSSP